MKTQANQINFSGSVKQSNLNILSDLKHVSQSVIGTGSEDSLKDTLLPLLSALKQSVEDQKGEFTESQVKVLEKRFKALEEEANEDDESKDTILIQANRFMSFIGSIAGISPKIVDATKKIIALVS